MKNANRLQVERATTRPLVDGALTVATVLGAPLLFLLGVTLELWPFLLIGAVMYWQR